MLLRLKKQKQNQKVSFITFEGIDGCGKSTHARLLFDYLIKQDKKILFMHEPGSTLIGEGIRKILIDKNNNAMSHKTEALLFMAARAQLIYEKIMPALKDDFIIICDRFIDSSLVYQGIVRNLGVDFIKELNSFATNDIKPDVTFFLDVKPNMAQMRKNNLGGLDRFESESYSFYKKVYDGYKKVFSESENKDRVIFIDTDKNLMNTHKEIISMFEFG